MRATLTVVSLLLAGCAPHLAYGNAAGGVVDLSGSFGQAKGMVIADAHCHQFGMVAKSEGVNELRNTMRFTCVKP